MAAICTRKIRLQKSFEATEELASEKGKRFVIFFPFLFSLLQEKLWEIDAKKKEKDQPSGQHGSSSTSSNVPLLSIFSALRMCAYRVASLIL